MVVVGLLCQYREGTNESQMYKPTTNEGGYDTSIIGGGPSLFVCVHGTSAVRTRTDVQGRFPVYY
jgi:hypothetical protein